MQRGWPLGRKFFMLTHMIETAVVVQKAYEWNLWILPKVEEFPKMFATGEPHSANQVDVSRPYP
jgi:hypothetical protein